ncbi:tRNA dihydrouridine synthase DusB [Candidatus Omnitrophota bacterium]
MLHIGPIKIKSRLILAPMAGVSDFPFRAINRSVGCELAFVEMINARSLSYKSKKTKRMLYSTKKDTPLGVQIVGCEPEYIKRALEILQGYDFDILDFNAACPSKKVVRRGEGAALLKHPKKINRLLKILVKSSTVPVTIKIRAGWDAHSINAKEVALASEDAGISALFIHGRTRAQGYSGVVDHSVIKQVKKAVKIPVIASGDIFSPVLAKKMFDETGCDGLLVARGALGNPWIFKEVTSFLKNAKVIKRPPVDTIVKVMIEHLRLCLDFYGERGGVRLFRKYLIWYTKGFHKVRPLREKISHLKTKKSMIDVIKACRDSQRLVATLKKSKS